MTVQSVTKTATTRATAVDPRDIKYWTDHAVPCLKSLMNSAEEYTPKEHEAQVRLMKEYVIPNLGPRPSVRNCPSHITQSTSPIQMSINASTNGGNCVRYCWEMLGPKGGSPSDPLAIQATKDIVASLSKVFGFSTRWSDSIISAMELSQAESQQLVEMLPKWMRARVPEGVEPAPIKRIPFSFTAFDLKGSTVGMKLYINLKAKEIITGKSSGPLLWDTLRKFTPAFKPEALGMIEDYVSRLPASSIELVGIDCVEESKLSSARVKLYINTTDNSFNTVRDAVTLGGKVNDDDTKKGLEILRKIWHLLRQEPKEIADDDYDKPINDASMLFQKTYFSFELRPGQDFPTVKTYLPTWNYVRSDAETIQNYEEVFRILDHPWGQNGRYGKIVADAFGPIDHGRAKPLHCDASYIYDKKKGVYQTLYYSTPLADE